jgi:hypothetical protein
MLVSSFLLRWVLVCLILCLTDLRPGVQFLSLVCLWNCHEQLPSGFGTYRSGKEIHKTKLGAIVITRMLMILRPGAF